MQVLLVGGFLGAGKTTLLREVARRLTERGKAVGLITNDQAPELVDTALLSHIGAEVREVAGSCFCCDFNGFIEALRSLNAGGAEFVVAEPVGSCTDLSATIVQPLKELFPAYHVAPLSVLVDPARVRNVLREKRAPLHADASYILRLQLEEADCIVLSKGDTLLDAERNELVAYLENEFPHARVVSISALTGDNVEGWLDSVLSASRSGSRIIDVDYDRYANGEAVLGWLNANVGLRWTGSLKSEWETFLSDLFALLRDTIRAKASEVGHIKMLLETPQGRLVANLTGLEDEIVLRAEGTVTHLTAMLTVNARVEVSPEELETAFRSALATVCYARVAPTVRALHCLRPGRPVPTHRYAAVVE